MKDSTSFRIRLVAGASALIVDALTFDIHDVANNLICVYDYRGVSWTLSTPMTISFRGPWNNFKTLKPMTVDGFGGLAHIASVGVMDKSLASLTIRPIGGFPVTIEPFQTDWSLGFSAGGGMGAFSRMFPATDAAKAPWPHNL